MAKDTPLSVFGRTPAGDWLQVRAPARAGGWISGGIVRLNVPVGEVPVASDVPQALPPPPVKRAPAPVAPAAPAVVAQPGGNCDPSYPDVCIPSPPPDLDCGEISFRSIRVVGSDPHRFDRDKDGIGCEK